MENATKKKGEGTYHVCHRRRPPLTPPIVVVVIVVVVVVVVVVVIAVAVVVGGLRSGSGERMGVGVDGKKEGARGWQCHIWLRHGVTQ